MRRLLFSALLLAGCATTGSYLGPSVRDAPTEPLPAGRVAHEVFLLGNTGDAATDAVLRAVAAGAARAGQPSTVVLLGDQTTGGLPDSTSDRFAAAVAPLQALAVLRDVPGQIVAVPGDRDWARGKDGLRAQERALEALLGRDVLTPGDQAGGPREMELAEGFRLVALDTAWWLLDADDRPDGEAEGEDIRSPADVITVLGQILQDRDDDQVLVVGHHPLRSNGEHAGARTAGEGVLGLGVAALAAQTVGTQRQDLAAPSYRRFREALDGVLAPWNGLVYAAAHDHSLQVLEARRSTIAAQTLLVSGTGGGAPRAVADGRGAVYAAAAVGYQRLVYYANGRLWMEAVTVDPATGEETVALRAELAGPNAELVRDEVPDAVDATDLPPEIGTTVTQAADADFVSDRFANSAARRALWGRGYRDVWETPVPFEVLDLGREGGGLTPLQRGGGLQTTSLRLEGEDGLLYELRLLEKSGLAQVPFELRESAVGDIVLDQRSAMNPYGALVTMPLAEAAGVYQGPQRIVYVPDDPRLGRYRATFGDRLALLGVRPDDDVSGVPGLLGAADVVSAPSLRESLREDQDHAVDQRAYLRARLLDMVLGDWDRHQDQWRWAAFEPGELDPSLTGEAATKGKVYLPVARDRDFAFHDIGGLFPSLIGRFFDRRLQHYDEDIHRVRYLTQNGFPQDRRFLNALTRDDVRAVAEDLQARLTNPTIDRAVDRLPMAIRAQIGAGYRTALRGRRDDLVRAADVLYELHAGMVDVVGSDEREHVHAERLGDGSMTVTVTSYKGGEDGRELYRRTFVPRETNEVRVFGFGGRDLFTVGGSQSRRIGLRIVGGTGRDSLDADGPVTVYDTPDGLRVDGGPVSDRRADRGDVNEYDPHESVLEARSVYPTLGYRPTDGVVVGAAAAFSVPGFRLHPFAATHLVTLNVATASGGVFGTYAGRMRDAVAGLDLDVDALGSTSRYARNFYGIGNATPLVSGPDARLSLARLQLDAGLGGDLGPGLRVVAGPTVRYADAGPSVVPAGVNGQADYNASLDPQLHAGAFAHLLASTVDDAVNPHQGVRLTAGGAYRAGLTGAAEPYGQVGGEAVAYLPLRLTPQATLALRVGADHRLGDYPFFDAAVLGGEGSFQALASGRSGTLRGYRRERFAGRTAASASAEARAKLFTLATYVAPFEVGALAFADAGRVWAGDVTTCGIIACTATDPDDGAGLHVGAGAGLWFGVLDRAVLTATVGRSDESTLFTFGLGFAY